MNETANVHRNRTPHIRPIQVSVLAVLLAGPLMSFGAEPDSMSPHRGSVFQSWFVSETGRDHTTWSEVRAATNSNGRVRYSTNSYVELETGKRYWDGTAWQETRPEIELIEGGAQVLSGPHKVRFDANINSPVPVEVLTPDGKTLKFKPLGLAYYDFHAQEYVWIAQVRDTLGQLVSSNEVLYPGALASETWSADVKYTYRKSGLEQDVLISHRPPLPEDYNLNPVSTRLLVISELLNPNADFQKVEQIRRGWTKAKVTKVVDFGAMKIGAGTAFSMGSEDRRKGVPVNKLVEVIDGRTCLIEEVSFPRLTSRLRDLHAAASPGGSTKTKLAASKQKRLTLPQIQTASIIKRGNFELAMNQSPASGLVLDWELTSGSSRVLDGTCVVSGDVVLSGTTVLQAGAVIKARTNATLTCQGPIDCQTTALQPAFFTAVDDDTVGVTIQGSTGNPTNWYATCALALPSPQTAINLKHVRFRYARHAFYTCESDYVLSDSQFVSCFVGIVNMGCFFTNYNLLMHKVQIPFNIGYSYGLVEHLTCNEASTLVDDQDFGYFWWCEAEQGASASLHLVNSVTAAVTNGYGVVPVTSDYTVDFPTGAGVFQTVGAGAHYLVDGSTNRGAGTTSISAAALTSVRAGTTYPPVVLSNVTVTGQVDFRPQATRNFGLPDLGYHYTPIDYFTTALHATNATITVHPGTAVARDFGQAGISLEAGASIECRGAATSRIQFFSYPAVQEQPWKLGGQSPANSMALNSYRWSGDGGSGRFEFTDFIGLQGENGLFFLGSGWEMNPVEFSNCYFKRASMTIGDPGVYDLVARNNLFEGTGFQVEGITDVHVSNNLFKNTWVNLDAWEESAYTFVDNVVQDAPAYISSFGTPVVCNNNAYVNSAIYHQTNATEIILTNFLYASGPLGNYYQISTNLVNKGSRSAANAGLYHYTTRTTQVKETNSIVDIGLHYVAVGQDGQPLDSDGDGIADYFEDANGNGIQDGNETAWQLYSSPSGLSGGSGLQVFTPLK